MSPALALALHAAAFLATGWAAARIIRRHHRRQAADRITRARARARLPEEMFLLGRDQLGPDDDWAHQLLRDIRHLPTTKGDR
ncbi:hypothetical protein [Streptomyces sparsogenes]|uniref:Uncharacterized protein n=1 Tax=Streptomyces sparsogenes DSM 40356 TaxID=1331668 RepID=A0A1R1S805_9ACTN|nr:hypothetical protein [Streptomyces sparsogenes]OMI34455.1 hypothetical protein SPAR_36766 [Streptomyces sparsogenes DSM 40356]